MSLELLKTAFEVISHSTDWSLQLLRITTYKKTGTQYASRQITLEPEGELDSFVKEITDIYLGTGKSALSKYTRVTDYDGTADGKTVYKLSSDNPLIATEFADFISAVADPDVEADSLTYTSAYVIKGSTIVNGEDTPIKLVSMQNPITTLKHKFFPGHDNGKFKGLSEKILSLKPTLDIVVIGTTVYFMTMNGENLFNMERAYRSVCHDVIARIETADMICGFDTFKTVAEAGHNPRRFVSFNSERFEALKNTRTRKAMAKQFDIPLDENGNLDATVEEAAERIVKVLCNKGMVDPFKKVAVEVSGARPW